MARIRCHYMDCVFLDDGYCTAAAVEIDPDSGCATYTPTEDISEEEWEEEKEFDEWDEDLEDEEEAGEEEDEF